MSNVDKYANFITSQTDQRFGLGELSEAAKLPKLKGEPRVNIYLDKKGNVTDFDYMVESRDMSSDLPTMYYQLSQNARNPRGQSTFNTSSSNTNSIKSVEAMIKELQKYKQIEKHAKECQEIANSVGTKKGSFTVVTNDLYGMLEKIGINGKMIKIWQE